MFRIAILVLTQNVIRPNSHRSYRGAHVKHELGVTTFMRWRLFCRLWNSYRNANGTSSITGSLTILTPSLVFATRRAILRTYWLYAIKNKIQRILPCSPCQLWRDVASLNRSPRPPGSLSGLYSPGNHDKDGDSDDELRGVLRLKLSLLHHLHDHRYSSQSCSSEKGLKMATHHTTHLALMNRDQVVTQAGLRLSTPQSDASIPITDHNHPVCNL